MSALFGLLIGVLIAVALPRGAHKLGYWRPVAGMFGGLWIHISNFFNGGSGFFGLGQWGYGFTESILLLPLGAVLMALLVTAISQCRGQERPFASYYPIVLASAIAAWVLQWITRDGLMPFTPFFSWQVSLNWIVPFDNAVLAILFVGSVLAIVVPAAWRRWVARLFVVGLVGYVLVNASFQMKAASIARQYADAFGLEKARVHALPGPLSPLNWRLIVVDKDYRLHDTMVHLTREQELVVTSSSKRAHRLKALYKPVDKAVWRVYPRFGGRQLQLTEPRVVGAWEQLNKAPLKWHTRFAVAKRTDYMGQERCVVFRDLRFEGARQADRGTFLSCPESGRIFRQQGKNWLKLR